MSFNTLVLDNIEVLGYSHQNNFFGEKSFNYSTTKTLSIRGYVLDLTNTVGVKNIFTDTNTIKNLSQNFYNIIIKGKNFGVGKIVSLSFDEGNWVKSTKFNADIEIYVTANLQSLISKEFTNVNISDKRFDLIKSFSETFDLDFDENTKVLGGNHSISIEYNADNININVISLAQSLAAELLKNSVPSNLSEFNYTTRQEGTYKLLKSESYDIINGKCGFTKNFSYSTNNNLKPYSVNRNLNIQIDTLGIIDVNENCTIKAENDNPSLYENALIGLNDEIGGSYFRCNNLFLDYKNKLKAEGILNTTPLQKSIKINKFDGTIEYTINYSNDQKYLYSYIFEYTSTLERDSSYIWTVSEEGSIIGVGSLKIVGNTSIKYSSAEDGWNIIKTNIKNRCESLWLSQNQKASNQFNIISQNVSRSPFQGKITYNYKYTDDPKIRTDLGNIKRLEIEYSDDGKAGAQLLPIYKEFIIPNTKYAVVQNQIFKKQGNFSITAKADISLSNSNSTTNNFNGLSYLTNIRNEIQSNYFGGSIDKYLESADFSSDEIEQTITYTENYKYS